MNCILNPCFVRKEIRLHATDGSYTACSTNVSTESMKLPGLSHPNLPHQEPTMGPIKQCSPGFRHRLLSRKAADARGRCPGILNCRWGFSFADRHPFGKCEWFGNILNINPGSIEVMSIHVPQADLVEIVVECHGIFRRSSSRVNHVLVGRLRKGRLTKTRSSP